MGVSIEYPTNLFCDNNLVVLNTTTPECTLSKRHNSKWYHRLREFQVVGTVQVAKEGTLTNLLYILTKLLAGPRLKTLTEKLIWKGPKWIKP